jgi:rare lipoprotein A (peptidoglycan hydrolase)
MLAAYFENLFPRCVDSLGRVIWSLSFPILLALTAIAITGCSAQNSSYESSPHYYSSRSYQSGSQSLSNSARPPRGTQIASWYGPGFVGHKTSTGERFDPNELTAASKTFPLGSRLRVTNPDNGRSVVVRINDRGPFVRGRSLDLSHRAAQQIGLTGKGVGRVQVASADTLAAYTGAESSIMASPRDESYSSRYSRHTSYHHRSRRSHRHRNESVGTWLIGALHL